MGFDVSNNNKKYEVEAIQLAQFIEKSQSQVIDRGFTIWFHDKDT